jgi:myo-inositol 2-dehydrogenase/D-chiro-inositol 1-dehydrogenase
MREGHYPDIKLAKRGIIMGRYTGEGDIKVGIIGTGGMGTRHAQNLYRYISGGRVAGVYDLQAERAQRAAELCGNPHVWDDPIRLIEDEGIDAVLIVSPDDTHTRLTLACLRAGKPVLCEKPLATNETDALAVMAAESALGRRWVSVGFMRRFDPQYGAVKAISKSGELGRRLLFKGIHRNKTAPYDTSAEMMLTNSAGHDFDSARWLMDEEIVEVSVRGLCSRSDLPAGTRDLLLVEIGLSHDNMGVVEVFANDDYGYEVSAEVVCQRGTAATEQGDRVLVRALGQRGFGVPGDWLARFQEAYVAELRAWIESIKSGEPFPGGNVWDGYVALRVSAASIQALHSGTSVRVELVPRPDLYR